MIIADLHIHSRYSRATSRECVPEHLDLWARRKGIDLLGTGDFTHPAWRAELKEKLAAAEEGLYVLKDECRLPDTTAGEERRPRFVVSGEISSIYKKNGRVRKVHNLILLPGLDAAEALSRRLEAVGNIHSDGRPILGLDSRDLLEITLEVCPQAVFIPAHIWTPHFSMFGAFSGFDTIEECFEDLTPYIHALETGLSSDPPMNWRLSALDGYALVSNSDAHSPAKLGREANLLDIDLSYPSLADALNGREAGGLAGTIEFFPEEGKYHFDGHRNCEICLTPAQTVEANGRCPVCGGKLTIGVLHRVEQLADREEGVRPAGAPPFESLIPLQEVIAASSGISATGKKAQERYERMLGALGPEFHILRQTPVGDIERASDPCVAEGIRRMREGRVTLSPGFDGEYGRIQILSADEIAALSGQLRFFAGVSAAKKKENAVKGVREQKRQGSADTQTHAPGALAGLNDEQRAAVTATEPVVTVVAGPGTGKTKTLVARIVHLVQVCGVKPSQITAVTFTNKAAGEMRERLEKAFGSKRTAKALHIGTFHALCLRMLSNREESVTILDENEASPIAAEVIRELSLKLSPAQLLREVSARKCGMPQQEGLPEEAFTRYNDRLRENGVLDYDDILLEALALFEQPEHEADLRAFSHLLVDEFQDINDVQYRLVRAWSRKSKGLFAIGDPDQSIYGFRGSDARCFERLWGERGDVRRIRLLRNYRSTPEILGCSLPVIARNHGDAGECALEAQRESGRKVRLLRAADDFQEAVFVAKEINRMAGGIDMLDTQTLRARQGKMTGFADIAVLYRTHRQAEVLEKCLRQEGIPYVVTGRDKLLASPVVRGTAAFFRFLLDRRDRVSLRACLTTLLDCPETTARKAAECYATALSLGHEPMAFMLESLPSAQELRRFRSLEQRYAPRAGGEKPQQLLEDWAADVGIAENESYERMREMAVLHADMSGFLQTLALGQEGDVARSSARVYTADTVSLMTLHGAKGLEFPIVFLCGVNRGTLPLERPGSAADVEEERRLFYVGMTRAREELVLLTSGEPSAFAADIPEELLECGIAQETRQLSGGRQLSLFD